MARELAELITTVAYEEGVPTPLLWAIRQAEGGGQGREFGVLSEETPGVEGQARTAAKSLKNSAQRYETETGRPAYVEGVPTKEWLSYFAQR